VAEQQVQIKQLDPLAFLAIEVLGSNVQPWGSKEGTRTVYVWRPTEWDCLYPSGIFIVPKPTHFSDHYNQQWHV